MEQRFSLLSGWKRLSILLAGSGLLIGNSVADTPFITTDAPCNPVRVENCVLPYPSDVYTRADAASPTGVVIDVPFAAIRPEVQVEIPPSLTPESVFGGTSGFSAATTVLFELPERPDLTSIPADGGDAIVALDLDTGERIPLRVGLNEYARSKKVTAPKQVIEIYPRSRWQFSHRYVVGLTNLVKTETGENYAQSEGFAQAVNDAQSAIGEFYAPGLQRLQTAGVSPEQLISATIFTVRSEDEVTGPMRRITDQVYAADHPIKNLRVNYLLTGSISAIVRGDILLSSFRDENHNLDYGKTEADEYWSRFRLTIPRASRRGPVPVVMYGHGLGILKESDLTVALFNAMNGVATVSIDQPNHGSRIAQDGGYGIIKLGVNNVPLQVGMTAQSPIDFIALLKAVQTSMTGIDVVPRKFFSPLAGPVVEGKNGDGIPDLDTTRIFYQGTSLGGVLGATFIALAPDLKGAFLQVPGVGITSILSGSNLWDLAYHQLEPPSVDGAEALLLKAVMQHQMDYGDAINFVHFIHNPLPGRTDKKLAMVVAQDDGVVPNFSAIALAELTDTPIIGKQIFDMPGVRVNDSTEFENGNGIVQVPPILNVGVSVLDQTFAHTSFLHPRGLAALIRWTREEIPSH